MIIELLKKKFNKSIAMMIFYYLSHPLSDKFKEINNIVAFSNNQERKINIYEIIPCKFNGNRYFYYKSDIYKFYLNLKTIEKFKKNKKIFIYY